MHIWLVRVPTKQNNLITVAAVIYWMLYSRDWYGYDHII